MTFMQETVLRATPIWDACARTPFVQELREGTLPKEKFKEYMIQDSIYLKHYARIYGKAIYHSASLRDIQLFYSVLSFVNDSESAVRLSYLERFAMTDTDIEAIPPLPENQRYINFMEEAAKRGELCEILMAVLPCMLSYSYVFRKIAAEPGTPESHYWDFIRDYAEDQYAADCESWCAFADEKCAGLPQKRREELYALFEQASLLELAFWKMAYGEGEGA